MTKIIQKMPRNRFIQIRKLKNKQLVSGKSNTRSAPVRLSNAIALENYNSDLDYLTNMAFGLKEVI